ncbi:MAG TPA: hypothetical protein PKV41_04490, partial [Candidatus Omnitrophota bacterium]|nr:hypothetical protein [Candidatus Omnitrophota bacterium]
MKNRARAVFLFLVFSLVTSHGLWAQEAETIEDALKNGKISGAIGSYYEFVNRDADDSDYGWSTAYLTLKYETLSWKQIKMGVRFFAHGQLYSDHEDGETDPFDADVESSYTLPELYLDYLFFEKSQVAVGRWDHQKITHIDDNQSEGGYIQFREIENLDVIAGIMRRFAEIDYDDGEDFGRNNDAQDLDSESTYGPGSSRYLYFLEGKYRLIDMITANPYLMYQGDYASVYGIDTKIEAKIEDIGLTYGSDVNYYHVDADLTGQGDSNNYMVSPFIDIKPVALSVG